MVEGEINTPFPGIVLENILTLAEVSSLKNYVAGVTVGILDMPFQPYGHRVELKNRLDNWDPDGVVNKIQGVVRDYVVNTFYLLGTLEPRKFVGLRTRARQENSETYSTPIDTASEVLYTCMVRLNDSPEVNGGEIVYSLKGEAEAAPLGSISIHRNESINSWKTLPISDGTRYDFMFVLAEARRIELTYDDFTMEQSIDNDLSY